MWILAVLVAVPLLVVLYDLFQRQHAILRNFPIIGHFRYLFEMVGPELRQYIVTSNNEEKPFSRDERSWVYASSKKVNNYFGFGTDNNLETTPNYLIIRHAAFPHPSPMKGEPGYSPTYRLPAAKVLGGHRRRAKAFRPDSVVNISGMSFGSLSSHAVEAMNRGAEIAGCLQNTGEGGVSRYHGCGGPLVWQIGTGYFGCRAEDGGFSMERFRETVTSNDVRAIEIKLSQGAKPGMGGVLPAAKITPEISRIRGVPLGRDCLSPSAHTAFGDEDGLLDFVERLADETGLPVGIKSAVGEIGFWKRLARLMATTDRAVDFITIDGGEGARSTRSSVRQASPTKLSSSAPAAWVFPKRRSSRLRSVATWSTSRARLCSRPAASKRNGVIRVIAPLELPPRTSGWCTGSTSRRKPSASPTTSSPCAKSSCSCPAPAESLTPRSLPLTSSTSSTIT
jgi:glutamate synthase domain-containing protein 2